MRRIARFFWWSNGRGLLLAIVVVLSGTIRLTLAQIRSANSGIAPATRPAALRAATRMANLRVAPAMSDAQAAARMAVQTRMPLRDEHDSEGFVVRKGDPAVADALSQIDEAAKNGEWEKAFSAAARALDAPADAVVRRPDGFYVSARSHVRQILSSLPAAGRDAYRLFNDGSARKALEQLDSPDTAESRAGAIARLQNLFDRYFVTSVGDQIADRLGDAKFEAGDFAGAARCWGAILSDYPDTSIPAARTLVKRAIALSRAGRWDDLQAAVAELREKYFDQAVRLGGREVNVASLLEGSPASPIATAPVAAQTSQPVLAANLLPRAGTQPIWQMVFLDDLLEQQIDRTAAGLRANAGSYDPKMIIPATATRSDRVYLNWTGIGIAIDADTGKLIWRSEPFSRNLTRMQQMVVTGFDSGESSITVSPHGDRLLLTNGTSGPRSVPIQAIRGFVQPQIPGRVVPQFVRMMMRGSGVLSCLSALDGRLIWSSESDRLPDLCSLSILGQPLIADDTVYVIATPVYMATDVSLVAISIADGRIRWKMTLGSIASGVNFRGMVAPPKPLLKLEGERIYVLTGYGALVAIDLAAKRVEWVYSYESDALMFNRVGFRARAPEQFSASMQISRGKLYFKEAGGNLLYAVDTTGPSLQWQRRIDRDTSIAAVDASTLYTVGDELCAFDLGTREMRWSARTPLGPRQFQPFVEGGRAYVFGAQSLYGVDLQSGATQAFAGYERGGGAVLRLGSRLMCVSNRSVIAYDIPQNTVGQQ